MNKSVIVYGPQGCGKTTNAARLLKHFGLTRSQDLEVLTGALSPAPVGVLYLTNMTREQLVDRGLIAADARRVYSYDEAMSQLPDDGSDLVVIANAGNLLQSMCHGASVKAGWWFDSKMDRDLIDLIKDPQSPIERRLAKALVAEKLCLSHSELSEGMEGHRKGLKDDKLPHREMIEVELADAVIRICDLAGALGLDLGGAIAQKMAYNAVRPDHKKEAREQAGGKAY